MTLKSLKKTYTPWEKKKHKWIQDINKFLLFSLKFSLFFLPITSALFYNYLIYSTYTAYTQHSTVTDRCMNKFVYIYIHTYMNKR